MEDNFFLNPHIQCIYYFQAPRDLQNIIGEWGGDMNYLGRLPLFHWKKRGAGAKCI
jgi:hypothetical protein